MNNPENLAWQRSKCLGVAHLPGSQHSSCCVWVGKRFTGNSNLMRLSMSAVWIAWNSFPVGENKATNALESASWPPCSDEKMIEILSATLKNLQGHLLRDTTDLWWRHCISKRAFLFYIDTVMHSRTQRHWLQLPLGIPAYQGHSTSQRNIWEDDLSNAI